VQQAKRALGPIGDPLQQGTQLVEPGTHARPVVGSQHPAPPFAAPVPAVPRGTPKPHPQFFAPLTPQHPCPDGVPPEPIVEQLLAVPPYSTAQLSLPASHRLVELQSLHDAVDP
jgi:hypothetical protein